MFAAIGVMYGWSPTYMLEEMTVAQLMLFYSYGLEFSYPQLKKKSDDPSSNMTLEELKELYGEDVGGL